MNIINTITTAVLAAGLAASPLAFANDAYPQDVQALIKRADACMETMASLSDEPTLDRKGGMDKDDLDRNGLDKDMGNDCRDLDKQIVEVKDKHKHSPKVVQKIAEYDNLFYAVHWLQLNGLM